jgi:hypothetical protein
MNSLVCNFGIHSTAPVVLTSVHEQRILLRHFVHFAFQGPKLRSHRCSGNRPRLNIYELNKSLREIRSLRILEFKVVRLIPSFPAAVATTPFDSRNARKMRSFSDAAQV